VIEYPDGSYGIDLDIMKFYSDLSVFKVPKEKKQ